MTANNVRMVLTNAQDLRLSAEILTEQDLIIFFDYPFVFEVDDEYLYKAESNLGHDWIKYPLDLIHSIKLLEQ